MTWTVSMGIYVLEPSVLEHIPRRRRLRLPRPRHAAARRGLPVGALRARRSLVRHRAARGLRERRRALGSRGSARRGRGAAASRELRTPCQALPLVDYGWQWPDPAARDRRRDRPHRTGLRGYETSPTVSSRWSSSDPGQPPIVDERDLMIRRLLQEHGLGSSEARGWSTSAVGPAAFSAARVVGCAAGAHRRRRCLRAILAEARSRQPGVRFVLGSAEVLPFEAGVRRGLGVHRLQLDPRRCCRRAVAASIDRVLRPGGAVLWYDLRYPNPFNRANVRPSAARRSLDCSPGFGLRPSRRDAHAPAGAPARADDGSLLPRSRRAGPLRTHYVGLLDETGPLSVW